LGDTRVSSSMICWNEANTIDLAIKSVKDLVHEVVIFDTGSFDDTVKIAQETLDALNLSGQVKKIKITKLSDARLQSIDACDGHWVLIQDSNLVLSNALKKEIHGHIKTQPDAVGGIKSINLMGDYEHTFSNRTYMAHHRILINKDMKISGVNIDRPFFSGRRHELSQHAVNLSRVRPSWRCWLRGEQFDRSVYKEEARRRGDGHQNKFNTQHLWQKEDKYNSLLEYVNAVKNMTLDDVKQVAPTWFLSQLQLEATPLTQRQRDALPETIQTEIKNPRYKLIYHDGEIVGRTPTL